MRKPVAALFIAIFLVTAPALAATRLLETGSSLLYPLMNLWVAAYQAHHGDVEITTQSTGSGTGISQAIAGVAQIGASDAYMPDAKMHDTPMLNIPLAISAQQVNYNIPGLSGHLNLSGPVLAAIYSGQITYWDDPRIKEINHELGRELPHATIVPIHRSDGSGDTFIFSQYLSKSTPAWSSGAGYGTTISWPAVATAVGAQGNAGMVQTCSATRYCIAYIGISYINETDHAGLGYAALENRDGRFVLPTTTTISAAAHELDAQTPPDERISLIFAPGEDSYPIINYEYAIVKPDQPDAATRDALKAFLDWALSPDGGQMASFLDQVHFLPLPEGVSRLSRGQVARIH